MADSYSAAEALKFKTQLKEFLGHKFIDQALLLLGFNTVIQSKYHTWILNDFSIYFDRIEKSHDAPNNQLGGDFNTINLLDTLWSDFHYPVIKFFQLHHGALFNEVSKDYQRLRGNDYRTIIKKTGDKRNNNDKNGDTGDSFRGFKVKPVEIRKINDNFNKFIKQVYQFYINLLKYFATEYENPLLPKSVLEFFNLKISPNPTQTSDADVQVNILYLIHKCLLSLGDISRRRLFIETFYVKPLVSNKDFFEFKSLAEKEKSIKFVPAFKKTLQYYQLCILILPALNEPYNHIGMVYNSIDDKLKSCYWFLRSQFTRISDFQLGLDNLNRVLGKRWFLNKLVSIFDEEENPTKPGRFSYSILEELDIILMSLVGYFYMPSVFKVGPNIVKRLTFSKVESHFFKVLSSSFFELLYKDEEADEFGTFFLRQLTVLFLFNHLISKSPDLYPNGKEELTSKLSNFTFRYIETIIKGLQKLDLAKASLKNPLTILRFILNWINENKVVLRRFQSRNFTIKHLVTMLNNFLDYLKSKEERTLEVISELVLSKTKPVRGYLFKEDVLFRDFLIIKYQFKDFNDEHLFKSSNSDLLVGNYTQYIEDNGIPIFLNNDVSAQLQEAFSSETINNAVNLKLLVRKEIQNYENNLRLAAVVVLGRKLLNNYFVPDTARFKYSGGSISDNVDETPLDINVSQNAVVKLLKKSKKIKRLDSTKEVREYRAPSYAEIARGLALSRASKFHVVDPYDVQSKPDTPMEDVILTELSQAKIPSSIQEIESTILNHTSQFENSLKYTSDVSVASTAEVGTSDATQREDMTGMVDTLVQDPSEPDTTADTQGGSNTWRDAQLPLPQTSMNFNDAFKTPAPPTLGYPQGANHANASLLPVHHLNPPSIGTPFIANTQHMSGYQQTQQNQYSSPLFTPFVPYSNQLSPMHRGDPGSTPFSYYNSQPIYGGPDNGQQRYPELGHNNSSPHSSSQASNTQTPYHQYRGGVFNPVMYPSNPQFLQGVPIVSNSQGQTPNEDERMRYTQNPNPYPYPYPQYFNSK